MVALRGRQKKLVAAAGRQNAVHGQVVEDAKQRVVRLLRHAEALGDLARVQGALLAPEEIQDGLACGESAGVRAAALRRT